MEILTDGDLVVLGSFFGKVHPDILNCERVNSMGYMFRKVFRYAAFLHYLYALVFIHGLFTTLLFLPCGGDPSHEFFSFMCLIYVYH